MPKLQDFAVRDLLDALDAVNNAATETAVNRVISHFLAIANQEFADNDDVIQFLNRLTDIS